MAQKRKIADLDPTPNFSSTEAFLALIQLWFERQGWTPGRFQQESWDSIIRGEQGLVIAPTGSGKTYSVLLGALAKLSPQAKSGVKLIWISPIRALAKEIKGACDRAFSALGLAWTAEIRTGDSSASSKAKQLKSAPDILITTPESLHVMLTLKNYSSYFQNLHFVVVDEWHELLSSKRGVQMELALSRLRGINPQLQTWGISATIGNIGEAGNVLMGPRHYDQWTLITASDIEKKVKVRSLIPEEMDQYPWSGHLGIKMAAQVLEVIRQSETALLFTNTRAQCEIWYQKLLDLDPDLAGLLAMHHGSISKDIREWVEDALYEGKIKAVVCTSSLDLGVDFRPVDTIIQVGSPKGVSRFLQRAGRSGHRPGATSHIFFVPTNALELIEAAALKAAIEAKSLEPRMPLIRCFDVLIQYLMTLAVGEGFIPKIIFQEIRQTHCFESVIEEEWAEILNFLRYGSKPLAAYEEYQKVEVDEEGRYIITNKGIALRHKLSIGTIVSDAMISVCYLKGTRLGAIEEWFVAQLKPGDVFWFAGRSLEYVQLKELKLFVKNSQQKNGRIPAYMGGRMPLSSQMSSFLRAEIDKYLLGQSHEPEMEAIVPILQTQSQKSILPKNDEFLIEYFESKEGFHLLLYPFEGRSVHEGMAALLANRIGRIQPISFSIAMNDYGFELLSDQRIDVEKIITPELFHTQDLFLDIQQSINAVEMAKRKFRDIARISGLIFQGFPGRQKKDRHLQSSAQLLFNVFQDYDSSNLLYLQTYDEVMQIQLEESRMRSALDRIRSSKFQYQFPKNASPFAFPIMVDRLRETMSTERLEDRILKMTQELIKP